MERTKLKLAEIYFTFRNNTDATIPMNILGAIINTNDPCNQVNNYSWDITGYNFGSYTQGYVQARTAGTSEPFTTFNFYITVPSMQAALNALNGLRISSFYVENSGGNSFIKTDNDQLEFGDLNFDSNGPATSGVYYSIVNAGTGTSWSILRNGGTIVTGNFPGNDSQPVSVPGYVNGDTFEFTGVAPAGNNTNVRIVQFQYSTGTSTELFNTTYNAGDSIATGAIGFVDPDFRYDIEVTEV